MSEVRRQEMGSTYHQPVHAWQGRSAPARRPQTSGVSPGWVVAGVAVLALGALAVYHFGPDFRRYVKMEMM